MCDADDYSGISATDSPSGAPAPCARPVAGAAPPETAGSREVRDYPEAARVIALWLTAFCDESLTYPAMIANAARRAARALCEYEAYLAESDSRVATLEARLRDAERIAAMALMELGKVPDPRLGGLRQVDIRKVIARRGEFGGDTLRPLTDEEASAALAAARGAPGQEPGP